MKMQQDEEIPELLVIRAECPASCCSTGSAPRSLHFYFLSESARCTDSEVLYEAAVESTAESLESVLRATGGDPLRRCSSGSSTSHSRPRKNSTCNIMGPHAAPRPRPLHTECLSGSRPSDRKADTLRSARTALREARLGFTRAAFRSAGLGFKRSTLRGRVSYSHLLQSVPG
ncbi:unnamed protein product [Pleuronectes platessa]|uniref:Uncharacterized protein n=1 Tax=Pleuronectes platessa TaxID=8262 RepID=A0A9N7VW43_PLEPL|nr:unnamed protein product [Pleuronectes platessa]